MQETLKERLLPLFPMEDGSMTVRVPAIQELMEFYEATRSDDLRRMTCRPTRILDAATMHRRLLSRLNDPNSLLLGVFSENRIAARISLNDYNPRNRSVEIGYWTSPDFRGQGWMRRALKLVCPALLRGGLNKLMVQTGAFNRASLKLMHSLGFREDGRLREHHEMDGVLYDDVLFSLTAKDLRTRG